MCHFTLRVSLSNLTPLVLLSCTQRLYSTKVSPQPCLTISVIKAKLALFDLPAYFFKIYFQKAVVKLRLLKIQLKKIDIDTLPLIVRVCDSGIDILG